MALKFFFLFRLSCPKIKVILFTFFLFRDLLSISLFLLWTLTLWHLNNLWVFILVSLIFLTLFIPIQYPLNSVIILIKLFEIGRFLNLGSWSLNKGEFSKVKIGVSCNRVTAINGSKRRKISKIKRIYISIIVLPFGKGRETIF